jgi:murein L,D-transpeptidase YcbB/YkuD
MDMQEKARQEIRLTDLFMSLARRASQGELNPSAFDTEWHYDRPQVDAVTLLQQAVASNEFTGVLSGLLPQHKSYRQLVSALGTFRELSQAGGWPEIAPVGPTIEIGATGDEIVQLRERLRLSGDLVADMSSDQGFDSGLKQAVKHFQKRHGLKADGVVGLETRKALHTSVDKRIEQITLNLERWRWLPRDLGKRHIRVNMAGFELQVREDDEVPLSMRVIVGKDERKTPAFTKKMSYLVFNPYWNVPNKIAREDLMPHVLHDPGYFFRKKIRVLSGWGKHSEELDPYSIDWQAYRDSKYLPFKFRQDPGERNSLGRVKFMLPNPYSVYLHDTPSRRLFNRSVRTFSSGCVRLEDPLALANYVMGDNWQEPALQRIIKSNKNRILALPEPIPVHMLYQTAWVDQAGTVQFRKDIYKKDKLMLMALPRAIEPVAQRGDNDKQTGNGPLSLLQN